MSAARPRAVSPDGSVVVGYGPSSPWVRAWIWRAPSGTRLLEAPGWTLYTALGIAPDGAIFGGGTSGRNASHEAYRIDDTGIHSLGFVAGAATTEPSVHGFSSDGRIVAGQATFGPGDWRPFVIGRDGVPHIIAPVGAASAGFATSVSDSGLAVGPWLSSPYTYFAWTQQRGVLDFNSYLTARGVSIPPGTTLAPSAITPDGKTILCDGTLPGYSGRVALVRLCYADCDDSGGPLSVADLSCFLQRFVAGNAYANCDGSATPPVLNVADFTCFLRRYSEGCP
jgi:uncharacterized membrane protein